MVDAPPRIAIIGAGMAGLACARRLVDHGVTPVVFDKGRGLGGRLSTRRSEGVQFDHGAQYLTAKSDAFQAMLDEAERAGAVARWPCVDETGYVGVPGMTGLAAHLAQGLIIRKAVRVTGISQAGAGWQIAGANGAELFDQVVLTVPAPQAMELLADHGLFIDALRRVRMDPCLALMLALPGGDFPNFHTVHDPEGPIAWIARDSSKPARPDATCLVAHASAAWSLANLEKGMDDVATAMLPLVSDILRNRVYTGVTMASVWFGWDNGIPTANTPPDYLAPRHQEFLAWPKWGQYFQTHGGSGEAPDMQYPQQLMELAAAWEAAGTEEERAAIWRDMLKIHSDQVFGIGILSEAPQPVVVAHNLRNVPTTGTWAWDPGAHFGLHRPDEFWFDPEATVTQ